MKLNRKRMNLAHKLIKFIQNKKTALLYIIFVIMSIHCHKILNLGDLVSEIIIYTIIGLMIKTAIETIDIKELFK